MKDAELPRYLTDRRSFFWRELTKRLERQRGPHPWRNLSNAEAMDFMTAEVPGIFDYLIKHGYLKLPEGWRDRAEYIEECFQRLKDYKLSGAWRTKS